MKQTIKYWVKHPLFPVVIITLIFLNIFCTFVFAQKTEENQGQCGNPITEQTRVECGCVLAIDSDEYEEVCTIEKRTWQEKQMPWVTEFYAQSYGVPKQYAPVKRAGRMVLVDDNNEVRTTWDTAVQRTSIDAKGNMIEELKKLLDK